MSPFTSPFTIYVDHHWVPDKSSISLYPTGGESDDSYRTSDDYRMISAFRLSSLKT